ncbi:MULTISPECIES: TIGR00645 family protein [Silvimonas]|uniref:TIGR00645 family protein n=1 Tax=Silvimonas TaxID=300264 RepID=UPI0024B31F98|nr:MULTISPECIES: TIGR00645 family protein [Silvimonas]MDR3428003.1 TIGR00645 family protein [Silvimonas sp.]
MHSRIESALEKTIFHSRWLLAPFYLALVVGLFALFVKMLKELYALGQILLTGEGNIIIGILSMVDVTLIANLLLIVMFSGYENFISKMEVAHHSEDKPSWMGKVSYSDLKLKLIGSIVAISAIDLLKAFVNIDSMDSLKLGWLIGIHLTFVLSGVLFAVMDRIAAGGKPH